MPVAQRAAVNTEKRGNVAIATKEEKVKYTIYVEREGKKAKQFDPKTKRDDRILTRLTPIDPRFAPSRLIALPHSFSPPAATLRCPASLLPAALRQRQERKTWKKEKC